MKNHCKDDDQEESENPQEVGWGAGLGAVILPAAELLSCCLTPTRATCTRGSESVETVQKLKKTFATFPISSLFTSHFRKHEYVNELLCQVVFMEINQR